MMLNKEKIDNKLMYLIRTLDKLTTNPLDICENDCMCPEHMFEMILEDCNEMLNEFYGICRYLLNDEDISYIKQFIDPCSDLLYYLTTNKDIWFIDDDEKYDLYGEIHMVMLINS